MSNRPKSREIALDVTAEIVQAATERNSAHCVIADAVKAALPDATRIAVDLQTIRFSLPTTGRRYIFLTPQAAQHVLLDFDQGIKPEPQRIRLGRPTQTVWTKDAQRARRKADPIVGKISKDHPDRKRVETIKDHGRTEPVIMNGGTPQRGALADPPKYKHDPITRRRYAGQRRVFGLKIMRP